MTVIDIKTRQAPVPSNPEPKPDPDPIETSVVPDQFAFRLWKIERFGGMARMIFVTPETVGTTQCEVVSVKIIVPVSVLDSALATTEQFLQQPN